MKRNAKNPLSTTLELKKKRDTAAGVNQSTRVSTAIVDRIRYPVAEIRPELMSAPPLDISQSKRQPPPATAAMYTHPLLMDSFCAGDVFQSATSKKKSNNKAGKQTQKRF
ncbi:hypothetical protein OUZ56_025197 [Daphnia magna]|uniref:Uncharacterized protein n=1 Tax=Daphnia magna TaxID=35525 RepID=A0ABQ9ZJ45_9CRUS|nr:hypothetical protein OUZ56_025197 [Daphnia magna]